MVMIFEPIVECQLQEIYCAPKLIVCAISGFIYLDPSDLVVCAEEVGESL